MNFLAHLFLSGDNTSIMVGNFIGDFVKGRQALSQLAPMVVKGVELHRAIDTFTDTHPIVQQSKNRLRPKYRHYSGVIVDVFYDHYLAKNWTDYHDALLPDFAARSYQTLEANLDTLPDDVQRMLPYMINGNWLVNYARTEGIQRALTGMARRTPYQSGMEEAVDDLIRHYGEFETEFRVFFPELEKHADQFLLSQK